MNPAPSLSILICGDICPTDDTRTLFDAGEPSTLFGDLTNEIKTADIALANLECVLSQTAQPAEKIGPVLTGKPQDADLLAQAGFNVLGCANNHIQDCGPEGVRETLSACKAAGVRTTGAGSNSSEAAQPIRIKIDGWTIGIVAIAEHEFNAATSSDAGAHIFDPLVDLERLREFKKKCDFVVLLYHGGIEYYSFPSPSLQKTCRALVRNGADLVLCQHSHVIGTFEEYEGGHILYGQGNSVFGYRADKPSWNEGLAVSVMLERKSKIEAVIKLLPIGCSTTGSIDLLPPQAAKACLAALNKRSIQAQDPNWLFESWTRFCTSLAYNQLPYLFGFGLWLTRLNRLLKGGLVHFLFNRRRSMTSLNVIRCDAHREAILTALNQNLSSVNRNST